MSEKNLHAWETLSRKIILDHNKFLTVENHTVKLPNGQIIPDWAWVIIPDAAIVLARTEDGRFLCFRQTKYAVEGTTLAPVGGMLEPNEVPLDGAKRELLEETGYESSEPQIKFGLSWSQKPFLELSPFATLGRSNYFHQKHCFMKASKVHCQYAENIHSPSCPKQRKLLMSLKKKNCGQQI